MTPGPNRRWFLFSVQTLLLAVYESMWALLLSAAAFGLLLSFLISAHRSHRLLRHRRACPRLFGC